MEPKTITEEELDNRIREALDAHNIPIERLEQYRFFRRMCDENAVLAPGIVKEDGTW